MNELEAITIVEEAAELAKARFTVFAASRDCLTCKGHSPDQELLMQIAQEIEFSRLSQLRKFSGDASIFALQLQRLIEEVLEKYSRAVSLQL